MMKIALYRILFLSVVFLFVCTFCAQAAIRPHQPGDFPASVMCVSALANVKVLRNDVTVDFRKNSGLPSNTAKISLVYEIDCTDTSALSQHVTFVLGNIYEYPGYTFEFDGQAVSRDTTLLDSCFTACNYPDSVQWKGAHFPYFFHHNINNERNNKYGYNRLNNYIPFVIKNLSKGRHTIKITYVAFLSSWFTYDDLSEHQSLIHLFRPEQNPWQSFNNLHLNFIVPTDCEYFANVEMEQKEVTDDAIHLYAYWGEVPQCGNVSLVIHKDESKAVTTAWIFVILAVLIIVGLCLFGLIKAVQKGFASKRESPNKVLFINYITAGFTLFIECCMLLLIDKALFWYLSLLMMVVAACIVAYYYSKKRMSRKILCYLNTLAYGLAILLAAYLVFSINEEGPLIGIIMLIFLLIELQVVARYSATRKSQKKLLRGFNNLMFRILFAVVITISFYLIIFGYDAIIHKMMEGYVQPNAHTNGMIIIVAPIIFIIALIALRVVNYLVVAVIKHKQAKRLATL